MVHTHRPPTDSARITGLVAVLVLLFSALGAGSAVAASPVAGAPVAGSSSPDGAAVVGTPTASTASRSAPAPSGLIVSSTPSGPVAAPVAVHPAAAVARSQPTIIAPNSGDAAVGLPSRQAERPASSQVTVVSSVVATASPPPVKPALVQLDSAGPLVGSAVGRPPAAAVVRRQPAVAAMLRGLPLFVPPAAPTVSVSVAMEGVYLSASTSARHPGQRPLAPVAGPPEGPAGLGSVSLGSPVGPGSPVRDGSAWLGNAPLSSSGPTGASLLGTTAVLAAMTLLAGASWRRRPWVWPELGFQSLLCSAVLDRPG